VVIGEDNMVVLKKLETPFFSEIDKLLKQTREFAKKKGLKETDVEKAIRETRKKWEHNKTKISKPEEAVLIL